MPVELDYMENYITDELAQAAYPSSDCSPSPDQTLTCGIAALIIEDYSNNNMGAGPDIPVGHTAGGITRSLLKFDFSGIGSTAKVLSATLRLYCTQVQNANNDSLKVYRVKRDWVEGVGSNDPANANEVTWNSAKHGTQAWTTAGCGHTTDDRSGVAMGEKDGITASTWIEITLSTSEVEDWIDGTNPNYGMILIADTEAGDVRINFHSDDISSYEPQLVLTFINNLQCYSEAAVKQEGLYSLKVVAKQIGSLNDTLTRTVDPTINLSDLTKNKFYIYAERTGSHIKITIRDSGSTITETTPNVLVAGTWQAVEWDISGVANPDKDAIDRIIVTIVNADGDNTLYLDNMFGGWPVLTLEENLAMLESLPTLARALTVTESLALLESLPTLEHALTLEELLALKEEETADISSLLTESLGLLESLPTLERGLTLNESLALLEALTEENRALTLLESLALLESLPTLARALTLTENLALLESETADISSLFTEKLALKEDLTQLGHALTLTESLALLEELHAETLLFKVDKVGNIIIPKLGDTGNAYVYIDEDGKLHRGAGYP